MAAIHDLIRQIDDPQLRSRLTSEWAAATRHRKFGLVFERHLPEVLPMFDAKPKRGDLACLRQGSLAKVGSSAESVGDYGRFAACVGLTVRN